MNTSINSEILLKSNDKSFHVLYYILSQIDIERETWYSNKTNKDSIILNLKISTSSLDKYITTLKTKGIIIPTSTRSEYTLISELLLN